MLKGYVDAYKAFGNEEYLQIAEKNASFIVNRNDAKRQSIEQKL